MEKSIYLKGWKLKKKSSFPAPKVITNEAYYWAGYWEYLQIALSRLRHEFYSGENLKSQMQTVLDSKDGEKFLYHLSFYLETYPVEFHETFAITNPMDLIKKQEEIMRWTEVKDEEFEKEIARQEMQERTESKYGPEWTEELREKIRKRDKYQCQNPYAEGHNKVLNVHHIDYDKRNCKKRNLITLCQKCHNKTNHNRFLWMKVYQDLMRERFPKKQKSQRRVG